MNANELRVGNYVLNEFGSYNQIKSWHFVHADMFEPIPLTPEILGKAGFERYKGYPSLWRIKTQTGEILLSEDFILQSTDTLTQLKYVHSLQNLFFTLTGEELEVNL